MLNVVLFRDILSIPYPSNNERVGECDLIYNYTFITIFNIPINLINLCYFTKNDIFIKCLDSNSEPTIPSHHRRNVQNLRHQTLLRRGARNSQSSRADDDLNEVSALWLSS